MSTLTPSPEVVSSAARGGTWTLSWRGVRTVAVLELRQRVRANRWFIVLAIWFAVLFLLTFLIRASVHGSYTTTTVGSQGQLDDAAAIARHQAQAGRLIFGIVVYLVLSLGALIAPALSATSVNGDRIAGVLATLQTTLLSPAEIVIGKLLAAWTVALALLATAAPFLIWGLVEGGTPFGRFLVVIALLALTLLVLCAIALGWSAITARTGSSAVLTYLTVAFLGLGLPLLFALTYTMVTTEETVKVRQQVATSQDGNTFTCEIQSQQMGQTHTERTWWLLAASPYVVIADAAPRPADADSSDPLSTVRDGVREARLGPPSFYDYCGDGSTVNADTAARIAQRDALGITWPYGLAADLLIGAAFTVLAIRRLRTPTRQLPRGTRVA